jgi:NAD(P) transhydrogenase subunit alpha
MQKIDVLVETGAGTSAFSPDEAFSASGARVTSRAEILERADILVQVGTPDRKLISLIAEGKVWVSQFNPLWNTTLVKVFQEKGITSFSLDALPRTTRAQAMDVLSSMATVAGYKAVLEAASLLPSFFPMFMTAAGTIRPANVLILGAGLPDFRPLPLPANWGRRSKCLMSARP